MSQPITMQNDANPDASSAANILIIGSGQLNRTQRYTELWMPDGQVVRLQTVLLTQDAVADLEEQEQVPAMSASVETQAEGTLIPLVEEQLTVGKRTVTTGKVLLRKTVQEYQETLNEPLAVQSFDVERVALNQVVETSPEIRQEGNTTIYPLVEEQLILTKQLVLKEELRVTRRDTERRDTQVVTLHREHMIVERVSGEDESKVIA